MDGFKRRLKDSIQFRLAFWLSLAILGVALVAGVFSFGEAFHEAHELQDDVLRQVAALFDHQHLPIPHPGDSGRLLGSDEESRVIVQYLDESSTNRDVVDAGFPLALPATLPDGLQTITVKDEPFRILVKTLTTRERIAVAQETGIRDEIARESALRAIIPFMFLVPILLLLVAELMHTMFKPIFELSAQTDRRTEQELHPLETEPLPVEVRPFVVAINRLLGRVSQSMEAQRRFVADAAHELRSPLTALTLQAERLSEAEMSDTARERLATLRQGIERGGNLLDQLLTLARAQSTAVTPTAYVSVQQVYRRVLEDLMPLAEAKHIDIGVKSTTDAQILVSDIDLSIIVKNLVDNAIRYTPDGGRVDLSIQIGADRVVLQVEDSGPGIPPEERGRVFDSFYRLLGNDATGSGLGLSIVQAIAERIGAQVCLNYASEQTRTGLRATVAMPEASTLPQNRLERTSD